jgi:hypothetical protein
MWAAPAAIICVALAMGKDDIRRLRRMRRM